MNDCSNNSQFFDVDNCQTIEKESTIDSTPHNERYNVSQVKDQSEEEPLWSIDDDTFFHPLGLINHGTVMKSVFVTWSEDYLLNFVFKKSQKKQRTNLTKVRLDVRGEEIRQILILDLNTLLLMQSGRVYHFSSVKSMHPVKWLSGGVRCISMAVLGFSVIRMLPDKTLRLEVYEDVTNLERSESTLRQSYNITFDDENLFQSNWLDDRFTLLSQKVDESNYEFLEHLTQNALIKDKQEIHFFTVSGSIFVLIPETDPSDDEEYYIQPFATYASNIELMKILCDRGLCIIFLQTGAIDIWYVSQITPGMRKTPHCCGASFLHYEFASNGCFYYTDGEKVSQLTFHYDQKLDTYRVEECSKEIFGIQAITWMESIQQLICLSSNNIFYQLSFVDAHASDKDDGAENFIDLYELTPAKMSKLLEKAALLHQLQTAPAEIHKAIEHEYVKQELIAVAHKACIYAKLCSASLEFRLFVPKLDVDTVMIHARQNFQLNENSLFALISLKIQKHAIFCCSSLWQLHINFNDGHSHIFSITPELVGQALYIILPLYREKQTLLPEFQIMLNTFVRHEDEFVAINLPVTLNKANSCYKHLFSSRQRSYNHFAAQSLENLVNTFNRQSINVQEANKSLVSSCKFALTKDCNFPAIIQLFHPRRCNSIGLSETHHLNLHFISQALKITHSLQENVVTLEAEDASILYYAKHYILSNVKSLRRVYLNGSGEDQCNSKLKLLMQYQADIERCYGLNGHKGTGETTSALYLENMKSIYTKLRKELHSQT